MPPNSSMSASPAARGFAMPAEFAAHDATWMIFPPAVYDGPISLDVARDAWCDVARAVARFEPVRMLVREQDQRAARQRLGDTVRFSVVALDDAWARDVAPTFVTNAEGDLAGVDWRFNGWGAQSWASYANDDAVAGEVTRELDCERFRSSIVNEGGGLEVDGAGTVIVTETVQLDPDRNGALTREQVEGELRAMLGVTRVVWLARGLSGDYESFGTRGHVDLLVKFVAPGRAVFHDQQNREHPDYEVSRAIRATLEAAGIEAVSLVAPRRELVNGRVCDWTYVNCSFVNGGVVLGVYDDDADDAARDVLASLVPEREIVTVNARTLFALGGGVHCITQQQPRTRS